MKRVLLTGATGFIGHAAAAALNLRAFDVHGTARRLLATGTDATENMTLHEVDLLESDAASALVSKVRPTHLLLAGWTTKHGVYWTDPLNDKWEAATNSLVRTFFSGGGQRAVLVGTCAEYNWDDPVVERGPIREDTALGTPHTPYGRAKRRSGEALQQNASAAGADYAIARLFYPIGPGEDRRRLLPSLITALLTGQPADLGPGEHVRDIADVRDVGTALASLVDSRVIGPVNIGSGKPTRIAELARYVGNLIGRPDLIRIGALARRPGEPVTLIPDVSRLNDEVGFHPRYSLENAIETAVHYWQSTERGTSAASVNSEAHHRH
jgi:nucleoside-diphosphate-sugar epimerase